MFLHSFQPQPLLLQWGHLQIHWYGLTMALALLAAITVVRRLAVRAGVSADTVYDLCLRLIIGAFIGARLYAVGLFWPWYLAHPTEIIAV